MSENLGKQLLKSFGAIYDINKPQQLKNEFLWLTMSVALYKPKTIVEIGVKNGGAVNSWSCIFEPTKIIGIDINPKPKYLNSDIIFIQGDSKQVVDKIKNILDGDTIDFLFLDGSHHYNDVKSDFELYKPLVSNNGGVIGFHDIYMRLRDNVRLEDDPYAGGVTRFWNEIKDQYHHESFYHPEINSRATGTGIIFL